MKDKPYERGTRVAVNVDVDADLSDWLQGPVDDRKRPEYGAYIGTVQRHSDSHGLVYEVHFDGDYHQATSWYLPHEVKEIANVEQPRKWEEI